MSQKNLGIIEGGQLGSMMSQAAKKLKIKTTIYADDIDAPEQNLWYELSSQKVNYKKKHSQFYAHIWL